VTWKAPETETFPKGLPQPAIRAFVAAGYLRLEDLAGASEKSLLALHGVGPTTIPIIRRALADRGLNPMTP
jgi:hypothetical protein